MEYSFYLAQKFFDNGQLENTILTAQEAEDLGYEDGHTAHGDGHTLYVDGYNSKEAIQRDLDEWEATRRAYNEPSKPERHRIER